MGARRRRIADHPSRTPHALDRARGDNPRVILAAVGRALPGPPVPSDAVVAALEFVWREHPDVLARLRRFAAAIGVDTRHLVLPLPEYAELRDFGAVNDAWIRHAVALGEQAIDDALSRAGLAPRDVDALFTVTVTGVASPSLDALLMNRMPLRADLKRVPLFGLGCAGGVAGVARAAEHVLAFPDAIAVVLAVELCSLTFQRDDRSSAHVLSSLLFGDGAAAVVLLGATRAARLGVAAPRVVASQSTFYPGTTDVMGWRIGASGFSLVLSPRVPALVRERLGPDVDRFLAGHRLTRKDIGKWICHPGGPKVLHAVRDALDVPGEDVSLAAEVLARRGNLSSVSVLMVLGEVLAREPPPPGTRGLMIAMGPAFASELVLVTW